MYKSNALRMRVKERMRDRFETALVFELFKAMLHRRRFLKIHSLKFCDIWQKFYFSHISNNENFKTEVEQTNFVTH